MYQMAAVPENKTKLRPTPAQRRKLIWFVTALTAAILLAFTVAAGAAMLRGQWRGVGFLLNGEAQFSSKALLIGDTFGLVFGLVDSLIISFGMEAMSPYLPGDEVERAGWSNAVSNGAGALLGAFAASALRLLLRVKGNDIDGPVYGSTIGVVIGCAAGVQIARISRL